MSVTFWCPEAPRKEIPCPYCQWAKDGGYDHDGMCEPAGRCTGTREASESPEVNWSNTNARAVLELLGFPVPEEYVYGECDGATMRQAILKARNSDRSSAEREFKHTPAGSGGMKVTNEGGVSRIQRMGPQMFEMGNTDDDTLRRLASLEVLVIWAQENGHEISWG